MIKYTVWTGSKFKGCWDSKELALRYMASRGPESRPWSLVSVDLAITLNAEVPAMIEKMKAEDIKPWGTGKLHLPTVHRLRLDSPGGALKGFTKANGFSVLIPDRKVMDNAKVITKRDDRLKAVTADSSPEGAVISFKFRGPVPTYKVRLRNDYVEFFISAPGNP